MLKAMMMIEPVTVSTQYSDTRERIRPLEITPNSITPKNVPITVPLPPLILIPPISADARIWKPSEDPVVEALIVPTMDA